MNVGEVIRHLSKFDPELPVVMSQEDEPLGNYEVMNVEPDTMSRDDTFQHDPNVWHSDNWRGAPKVPVVFLGAQPRWQPTIDAEIVPAAIEST